MRAASAPRVHLFVCANRRAGSPLGPGCAERGDALYDALKREVSARRLVVDAWVTKTHCLGICPREGATAAMYSATANGCGSPIRTEVQPTDAAALLDEALAMPAKGTGTQADGDPNTASWDTIESEVAAIEELQRVKVMTLARRLKPGLTLEDIQNPHDFPELDDPDWHYADGILTGIQSVTSALRAMRRRQEKG
jgi:predicted metal-binding protein